MICSSEKRFFTSNLLGIGNWTPNRCATQTRGDVGSSVCSRSTLHAFDALDVLFHCTQHLGTCCHLHATTACREE
ncbi:hypothetical protein EYC54_18080 [Xanthomonas oryzae]|nr:hypothetical protein EYC54_18080 [Xanthomonas oryzae]